MSWGSLQTSVGVWLTGEAIEVIAVAAGGEAGIAVGGTAGGLLATKVIMVISQRVGCFIEFFVLIYFTNFLWIFLTRGYDETVNTFGQIFLMTA